MQSTLGLLENERLHTSESDRILILDSKIDNLKEAIDLFTRAQEVPAVRTQFGGGKARGLRVTLPPGSDEYHFPPMIFHRYVYQTEEPVEILYLRELMASKRSHGLREMEVGLIAAISQDGNLINFYSPELFEELGRAGVLKSQIG